MTYSNLLFPEIETDRLKLSILTLDDSDAVYKHFSDEDVTRYMDISPCKDIKEAEEIIRFHIEDTGCRWGKLAKLIFKSLELAVFIAGFKENCLELRSDLI